MNKYNNQNITLDKKHSDMIKEFENNDILVIPKLKKNIEKLEKSLNKIKKSDKKEICNSKILELKNEIYILEKNKKDYYLNNSKYIFEYFEDKKNINYNNSENNTDNNTDNNADNADNKIDIINNKKTIYDTTKTSYNKNKNNLNNEKLNNFFNIKSKNNLHNENIDNKNNIVNENYIQKYFYNLNNLSINYDNYIYKSDICSYCNIGEMIYVDSEGVSICNNCSRSVKYLIENEKPSYKEPPKEVCFYAYKRINHLREILAQFQAKESTNIPDNVFQNIKNQIKKERVELKDLTNKKTKEILKNLGYNKYYEHIPFIKDKLGIKPPIMSQELEEKLCNLFMEIQKPYSKYCPKDRVNFLNYYYTLYKLCELLNEKTFLPFFPMLKDREKRMEQDDIWKKICEELNWKFIPTI